jgi:hypothetical protein
LAYGNRSERICFEEGGTQKGVSCYSVGLLGAKTEIPAKCLVVRQEENAMHSITRRLLACGIIVPLMAAFSVPAAMADVATTYTITFTGGPIVPTEGTFTYDSTNPQFTNFTVTWNGLLFDLTSSANDPYLPFGRPACIGNATGAAASFLLMDGQCPYAEWIGACASPGGGTCGFQFDSSMGLNPIIIEAGVVSDLQGGGSGSFTIAAEPVPEPGCLLLVSSGALAAWKFRTRLLAKSGCGWH